MTNTTIRHYDGVSEVVSIAHGESLAHPTNQQPIADYLARPSDSEFWNGYSADSFRESVGCAPQHIVDAVRAFADRLEAPEPKSIQRRRARRLDEGDEIDVERFRLQRRADCWEEMRREHRLAPRVLRLGIATNVNGGARPEDLLYRGAAAVAYAEIAERAGYQVEIVGVATCSQLWKFAPKRRWVSAIDIKPPGCPLDVSAVAFALCEIAFHRLGTMLARAREMDGTIRHPGWGRTEQLSPDEIAELRLTEVANYGIKTREQAEAWLKDAIKRLD